MDTPCSLTWRPSLLMKSPSTVVNHRVQNVKKKYKGAGFSIVTYKDPKRYYFRIDKHDITE